MIELGLPADADEAELDEAATRLRKELLELDVDRVQRPTVGEAPPGARAAEILVLGGLVLSFAQNAATVASVVGVLRSWLARGHGRSLRLEIDGDSLELTRLSSVEQERLISAWMARHSSG